MSGVLDGKVALVTGASRGIGKAIAIRLARSGANIAIGYANNEQAATEVAEIASRCGISAKIFKFDVCDANQVNVAFKSIASSLGSVDILVNNAGFSDDALLLRTSDDSWRRVLDVNLSAVFYCSRAASKSMIRARWGRIINISSVIGEMGNPGQCAYSAAKAGIFGLTKTIAKELGVRGVTVNAVTPGYIETDMTSAMNEELKAALLSHIPLGRFGNTEDVAELVNYLASPASGYITGEIIAINGGLHM